MYVDYKKFETAIQTEVDDLFSNINLPLSNDNKMGKIC